MSDPSHGAQTFISLAGLDIHQEMDSWVEQLRAAHAAGQLLAQVIWIGTAVRVRDWFRADLVLQGAIVVDDCGPTIIELAAPQGEFDPVADPDAADRAIAALVHLCRQVVPDVEVRTCDT